jgi:hypothetical protein
VRTLLRCCVVAALIVTLVEAPVFAAPDRALGVVTRAERAQLGTADAANGATVFDGDTLSTDKGGALNVRLGAAQLYLLPDSGVAMRRTPVGASAVLQRGTVVLASGAGEAVELHASEARIRPKTNQPTLAQVTLSGPYELVVTSNRGQLDVTIGEETHLVSENTSYRVEIEPAVPNPQGGPPIRAARSRFFILALLMIGATTGVILWRALISPDN